MPHTVTNRQGWPPDRPGMLCNLSHPTQALQPGKPHTNSSSGWAGYQPHTLCSSSCQDPTPRSHHTPRMIHHPQTAGQLSMLCIQTPPQDECTQAHTPHTGTSPPDPPPHPLDKPRTESHSMLASHHMTRSRFHHHWASCPEDKTHTPQHPPLQTSLAHTPHTD